MSSSQPADRRASPSCTIVRCAAGSSSSRSSLLVAMVCVVIVAVTLLALQRSWSAGSTTSSPQATRPGRATPRRAVAGRPPGGPGPLGGRTALGRAGPLADRRHQPAQRRSPTGDELGADRRSRATATTSFGDVPPTAARTRATSGARRLPAHRLRRPATRCWSPGCRMADVDDTILPPGLLGVARARRGCWPRARPAR